MKLSSSTEHLSNDEHKCEGNKLVFNSIIGLPLCVPPLMNTPNHILFFKSPISSCTASNKPRIESLAKEANRVLEDLHTRIVSSRDKCVRFLDLFASQNPVLSKLFSLSSEYRKFCQTNCRNYRHLNSLSSHNFAAILPGDSVAGIVAANGLLNFLNIYNTLLVVRLVLTWFPNSPPAIVSPLSTLCDPYLNIFRGIIPPLGGTLDLSPILAFLVLNALTSTASALPAELPSTQVSQKHRSSNATLSHLTACQKKWMKRFDRKGSKSPSSSNDY